MIDPYQAEWLTMEVENWEHHPSYKKFKNFVLNLLCVNDPAERTIKLAQDLIADEKKEDDLQAKFVDVAKHRQVIKGTSKGKKTKDLLRCMGGI